MLDKTPDDEEMQVPSLIPDAVVASAALSVATFYSAFTISTDNPVAGIQIAAEVAKGLMNTLLLQYGVQFLHMDSDEDSADGNQGI
jgi:hypothetical protein